MVELLIEYEVEPLSGGMEQIIRQAAEQTLAAHDFTRDAEVSVTVTGDREIRIINHQFREIDKATDVLSFPMYEFEAPGRFDEGQLALEQGAVLLGDIVLSMDRIYAQAQEYGHSPQRELAYLTVHSMLHLLGYDHMQAEDKQVMREQEERILKKLGQARGDDI